MNKHMSNQPRPRNPDGMIWPLLAVGALAMSTGATGYGLFESLRANGTNMFLSIVMGGMVSLFISGLAFWTWRAVGQELRERRSMLVALFTVIGLLLTAASLTFSSAATIFMTQTDVIRGSLSRSAATELTMPLQRFATNLSQISARARSVSALAKRKSDDESQFGGSCGYPTRVGVGPLTRLRADHAAVSASQADAAEAMNSQALEIMARAGTASAQDEFKVIYKDAATLLGDPRRAAITHWAQKTRVEFANESFFWEGQDRRCKDDEMLAALLELGQVANADLNFPNSAPVLPKPTIFHAVQLSLSDAGNMLGLGSGQRNVSSGSSVILLLFIAFAIDAVSAVSSAQIGRTMTRRRRVLDQRQEVWFTTREILTELVIDHHKDAYLVVPHGGSYTAEINAQYLATYCGLKKAPGMIQLPITKLRKLSSVGAKRVTEYAGKGATRVTLYELNMDAEQLLQKAVIVLGFNDFVTLAEPPNVRKSAELYSINGGAA